MVKGVNVKPGLDIVSHAKDFSKGETAKLIEEAGEIMEKRAKTVSEIPAESIRAKYAPQLDSPVISRFKHEAKPIPLFSDLPREKQVELLVSAFERNAPKTKEEAIARLENFVQEAKRTNTEIPEDLIQAFKDEIMKKFGG